MAEEGRKEGREAGQMQEVRERERREKGEGKKILRNGTEKI